MKQRLFLAVELDDEVRHGLAAHLDAATGSGVLPGRPVPAANWHITLRFIGYAFPEQLDRLLHEVDTAELSGPFRIGFGGLGAFPRPSNATVLWLGIEAGAGRLVDLAAAVEAATVGAGFGPEERPFHPHLTLSRIRPHEDVSGVVESFPGFPLKLGVDGVTLFRSILGGATPARYEPVERFPLTSRGQQTDRAKRREDPS
ncbi:MAG TPA: RNA 2',3'-cyclic phosphodiesterase [Acidimicrobiia bacterium]